jgi:hypothetical protein
VVVAFTNLDSLDSQVDMVVMMMMILFSEGEILGLVELYFCLDQLAFLPRWRQNVPNQIN